MRFLTSFGIPNSDKSELAEVWRNEGSPSHSRNLIKKMCIEISFLYTIHKIFVECELVENSFKGMNTELFRATP